MHTQRVHKKIYNPAIMYNVDVHFFNLSVGEFTSSTNEMLLILDVSAYSTNSLEKDINAINNGINEKNSKLRAEEKRENTCNKAVDAACASITGGYRSGL